MTDTISTAAETTSTTTTPTVAVPVVDPITFTWTIPHWEVSRRVGTFTDVVIQVSWRLTASNADNTLPPVFGGVKLPAPVDAKNFIKKEDITKEQLIEWIKPIMGYDKYVESLTARLNAMGVPQVVAEVPVFAAPKAS